MNIRYNIDNDTQLPHIYRLGVSEREVEAVLRSAVENRPGVEQSRVLIGRTGQGRWLRVIVSIDWDGQGVFVITAYELTGKPLKALRRRLKGRGRS